MKLLKNNGTTYFGGGRAGKGDRPRPISLFKWAKNWISIFGKKERVPATCVTCGQKGGKFTFYKERYYCKRCIRKVS